MKDKPSRRDLADCLEELLDEFHRFYGATCPSSEFYALPAVVKAEELIAKAKGEA